MKQTTFKSNILENKEIIKCKKEYKKSLKTGNFKKTNSEIRKSIEKLNEKYQLQEITIILDEEIKDTKTKYNLLSNVILTSIISILIAWKPNTNILLIIYILITMSKETLQLDNTNFLTYYRNQLSEYEKKNNTIDL